MEFIFWLILGFAIGAFCFHKGFNNWIMSKLRRKPKQTEETTTKKEETKDKKTDKDENNDEPVKL